jgi:aspartate 1-decarboxylase
MRKMLRGKIHRATVTGADLHYEGSVTIDRELMDRCGLIDHEAVHVWNVNNGEIPCHRVIASDGTLGGYSGGLPIKRQLLALEGRRLAS